jgi:hypothetical protein
MDVALHQLRNTTIGGSGTTIDSLSSWGAGCSIVVVRAPEWDSGSALTLRPLRRELRWTHIRIELL